MVIDKRIINADVSVVREELKLALQAKLARANCSAS